MRRGFKEAAKQLALDVRQEIGLDAFAPLDPLVLAEAYGIPVYPLGGFGCSDAALAQFTDDDATFSAALIPFGTARIIVDNDSHAPTRRRSSLAHEISHVVLEHQFTAAILGPDGCRAVHKDLEDEAEWFAGELLITFMAAKALARRGVSDAEVAQRYDVSPSRARIRMNASGAHRQPPRTKRTDGLIVSAQSRGTRVRLLENHRECRRL